jgi:hypothetical protein
VQEECVDRSVVERAWGFTQAEYVAALSIVTPVEEAEATIAQAFADLERDPSSNLGGDDYLFALLAFVSDSSRERVLQIRGWNAEELALQQERARAHFFDQDAD